MGTSTYVVREKDKNPRATQDKQSAQNVHLSRVAAKIDSVVLSWCSAKGVGHEFHLADFERDIAEQRQTTPGSAGRILRLLKSKGLIDYELLNRRSSSYQLVSVSSVAA